MLTKMPLFTTDALREVIRCAYLADDTEVLQALLAEASVNDDKAVHARAKAWAQQLRAYTGGGIDKLLNEFSLSTEEGVVLMCLAEALLRVPDAETADALIRDKLAGGDWGAHVGRSDSLFVNASAWALLFTGELVNFSDSQQRELHGVLGRAVGRLGQPVIRQAVRFAMTVMGDNFVLGQSIDRALERAAVQQVRGYRYSFDMLGEGARTAADADRYFQRYMQAIERIGANAHGSGPVLGPGISVKLSAIHPRYEFACRERVVKELVPRLKSLALRAREFDIGLTVDAEESDRLELSLDVIEAVFADSALQGWAGFGLAVQAYQKRAPAVIDWLCHLAQQRGRRLMLRLVKGAYWDTEIKRAQVQGLADYPVFSRKLATDVCYQACARRLLDCRDYLYPQFATHNAYTVAAVLDLAGDEQGYEFQRLHGMGEALYEQLLAEVAVPCRIYAPVGEHADLLAYLVRRLLENGANSSFVNNLVDARVSLDELLRDPVRTIRGLTQLRHPTIPLPADLYGTGRDNARGISLSDPLALQCLQQGMQRAVENLSVAESGTPIVVRNPADVEVVLGTLDYDDRPTMERKLAAAQQAFAEWSRTPVTVRANWLNRIADAIENHRDELMALCVKEAGKTVADALAEVREAVDFCRYYAQQAQQLFDTDSHRQARGVVLCVSPWNFPLAIFIGQVSAALVVGNTVIAKPAEQTSLIALKTLALMSGCGLPADIVQLVLGPGPAVGEYLVPDERVRMVMFTGSTETGRWLYQTLARRQDAPLPLIAETGGQNAMVVDSSALPEQVVDDVIRSAFRSAGQRCSALRVLFLQEEIAPRIIDMLIGAMRELRVGDPACLATDVGPVIDDKALLRLHNHVQSMVQQGKLLHACELAVTDRRGHYFAPHLYEIDRLSVLAGEVFGPILHVIRYSAEELDDVIDQINACGYGLTLGIHSRIQRSADYIARRALVGNVYINRDMVGAVVGVQPFGGRGLSGTGPKAGGPHYLPRLTQGSAGAANQIVVTSEGARGESGSTTVRSLRRWLLESCDDVVAGNVDAREQSLRLLDIADAALSSATQLPGPTGESNRLFYEPRGHLACVVDSADDPAFWLPALVSALATGNRLTVLADIPAVPWLRRWCEGLTEADLPDASLTLAAVPPAESFFAWFDGRELAGAIVAPASAYRPQLSAVLSEQRGALPALICETVDAHYPFHFLWEKTVTIDTTAAGGNASLMSLARDDSLTKSPMLLKKV